jgi:hypothetical protein
MNDERTAPDAVMPRPISMPGADGIHVAVVAMPVLQLEPAHVAEARRALLAQGRDDVADDAIIRLLWVARCLPAALDVLADTRSAVSLAAARFVDVDVELGQPPTERRSLLAVAYGVHGGVIVEVVEKRALLLARDDDAPPCCVVRFAVSGRAPNDAAHDGAGGTDDANGAGGANADGTARADGAGGSESSVPVTRFTVGTPPR